MIEDDGAQCDGEYVTARQYNSLFAVDADRARLPWSRSKSAVYEHGEDRMGMGMLVYPVMDRVGPNHI